jgi:hypothetical protein
LTFIGLIILFIFGILAKVLELYVIQRDQN